jgi:hypothetical protein
MYESSVNGWQVVLQVIDNGEMIDYCRESYETVAKTFRWELDLKEAERAEKAEPTEATAKQSRMYNKMFGDTDYKKHYGTPTLVDECNGVDYYEHPKHGDCSPVLAVSHVDQLATVTEFWDTDDFTPESEYRYIVHNGEIMTALDAGVQ